MPPPVAFSTLLSPKQIGLFPISVTTGKGFTVTFTVVSFVQPPLLIVTVYIVVLVGLTDILEVVALVLQT